MIPRTHPLGSVRDAFNAVFVEADAAGELMFYGRGAGGNPTASAILGDVVEVARHRVNGGRGAGESAYADLPVLPMGAASTRYHISLDVADRPGCSRPWRRPSPSTTCRSRPFDNGPAPQGSGDDEGCRRDPCRRDASGTGCRALGDCRGRSGRSTRCARSCPSCAWKENDVASPMAGGDPRYADRLPMLPTAPTGDPAGVAHRSSPARLSERVWGAGLRQGTKASTRPGRSRTAG